MYFDATEFAARLSTLRKAQGMTQEEMAEALNISLEHLSKMERGKRKPSIDLIIAMACYFHVSTDYLLIGKDHDMVDSRIKSVQGDSGHAQAQMVTDQYSHILDDDRKNNAALFEKAFYSGKGSDDIESPAETGSEAKAAPSGVDPDLLAKILSNPEMAALLTSLAKSLN